MRFDEPLIEFNRLSNPIIAAMRVISQALIEITKIGTIMTSNIEEQKQFWTEYLNGFNSITKMPYKSIGKGNDEEIEQLRITLPEDLRSELICFTNNHHVTLESLFDFSWGILLQMYSNCNDVVFGTAVPRESTIISGVDRIAGFRINAVPCRVKINSNIKVLDAVKELDAGLMRRAHYRNAPLADIETCSCLEGTQELFDNILVTVSCTTNESLLDDKACLDISALSLYKMAAYDLAVLIDTRDKASITYIFKKYVFTKANLARLARQYMNVLRIVCDSPGLMLYDLSIADREEIRDILLDYNGTKAEYPDTKTINQIFEEQVAVSHDKLAVLFREEELKYQQLNDRANNVAQFLRGNGVQADTVVGIMIERSPKMLVGILGILKAGGAYLPIDPEYPDERIEYIVRDSSIATILTTNNFACRIPGDVDIVFLDDSRFYAEQSSNLESVNTASNLAYVMYTSGSSGRPKGVMIEHGAIVNRLNWMQNRYKLGEEDVVLQKTIYVFDVSVWELFWCFFSGSCVCFLEPGDEKNPARIIEAVNRYKITTIHFVPSMLNAFLEYVGASGKTNLLKSLRRVFVSGEVLLPVHVKKFNDLLFRSNGTKLINLYGPTEAAIDVTYFDCLPCDNLRTIPIGRPIDNTSIYIIDSNFKLQPVGACGELCIAGTGLARGYFNNPNLTADKFINNPFIGLEACGDQGTNKRLMYKTGDLARWLPDGNIEYLGRLDHQVKIRGFRIELGEIESCLVTHEHISESAAVVKEDKNNEKYIVCYYVADRKLGHWKVKEFLAKQLPGYMVPNQYVQVNSFPLTANGKLDRKALLYIEESDANSEKQYFIKRAILTSALHNVNDLSSSISVTTLILILLLDAFHKSNLGGFTGCEVQVYTCNDEMTPSNVGCLSLTCLCPPVTSGSSLDYRIREINAQLQNMADTDNYSYVYNVGFENKTRVRLHFDTTGLKGGNEFTMNRLTRGRWPNSENAIDVLCVEHDEGLSVTYVFCSMTISEKAVDRIMDILTDDLRMLAHDTKESKNNIASFDFF